MAHLVNDERQHGLSALTTEERHQIAKLRIDPGFQSLKQMAEARTTQELKILATRNFDNLGDVAKVQGVIEGIQWVFRKVEELNKQISEE